MTLFGRSTLVALCLLVASAPTHGQRLPLRTSQEVFRLGGANAPEQYAFSATPRLIADESGRLYARVPGDGTIYIYSPEGEYIRRIGRTGEGPGEFQVAAAHGIVGDTLWVRNAPAPRISKFLKDGTHLQTFRSSFDLGYSFAAAAAGISGLLRAGHVYVVPPSPVVGVDKRVHLPVLVGNLERLDTVAWLPNPPGLFIPQVGAWAFDPVPVSPLAGVSPRGSGAAVVSWEDDDSGVMRVQSFGADGDLQWQRDFKVPRVRISNAVRDSLLAVAEMKARPQIEAARRRGVPATGSIRSLVERGLPLPQYYAPARRVLIGVDGTIWVEQMVGLAGGTWYVINADGSPAFQLLAPGDLWIEDASTEWLWGVTHDEFDVPYMVKRRIVGR